MLPLVRIWANVITVDIGSVKISGQLTQFSLQIVYKHGVEGTASLNLEGLSRVVYIG